MPLAQTTNEEEEEEEEREEVVLVALRYVSMLDSKLTVRKVGYLHEALLPNRTLEVVELDASIVPTEDGDDDGDDEPTPSQRVLSASQDHDGEQLHSTPLAIDRRVAFAGVLGRFPPFSGSDIDSIVLSRCLEYAANITTRRIEWCESVPVRKWFQPHQPPP